MDRREPFVGRIEGDELYLRPTRHTTQESATRPRRPAVALLLAILFTPAAFAYVGRPLLGIVLQGVLFGVIAVVGLSGWVQSAVGIWSLYAFVGIWEIGALFWPWWLARRLRHSYEPKWYNVWYVYLVLILASAVATSYVSMHKQRVFGFDTYRVPSGSMEPTVHNGDLIVVDSRSDTRDKVTPGDVIVFESWHDPKSIWIKRIAASPSQRVQFDGAGLKVNGIVASRDHAQGSDLMRQDLMKYVDLTLGPDEFYVLGDNRSNSMDSRTEGPIHRSAIIGRVSTIFYSANAGKTGPVR